MRRIALLTLLIFVLAQSALVFHTMEHGLEPHNHAGKKCELCLFAKDVSTSLLPFGITFSEPLSSLQIILPCNNELPVSFDSAHFSARAPPSLS